MTSLVGYTGFVGSNIYKSAGDRIKGLYNSKNIADAYDTMPDLLIYAGVRAEKYLANSDPDADMGKIRQAEENIRRISPKRLVLISTIDVYKEPNGADENTGIDTDDLHAYGYNRYKLEEWVRNNYENALIIRLPGLFGVNIKKNFIYDFIHVIPSKLKKEKYEELSRDSALIRDSYTLRDNGFYDFTGNENAEIKDEFKKAGFSALNFTDSRGVYQFYDLARLYDDIKVALDNDLRLLNISTEPISVSELYSELTGGEEFSNEIMSTPPYYDFRSVHCDLYGGHNGYLYGKDKVMQDIVDFVRKSSNEISGI